MVSRAFMCPAPPSPPGRPCLLAPARHDHSIRGYKTRLKFEPEKVRAEARLIILNTYRTLMTRGLKGCYLYAVDEGVREWLRERMG